MTGAKPGTSVKRLAVKGRAGDARTFGSIIVVLPSDTTGGAVKIQHAVKSKTYRFEQQTAETYSFVSYFAGCESLQENVTSGCTDLFIHLT